MASISLLDSGHVVIYCQEKLSRNSDLKLKTVWFVKFLTRIKMLLISIYKDNNLKFLERFLLKRRRKFQNNPMAKRTINKLMVWEILQKKSKQMMCILTQLTDLADNSEMCSDKENVIFYFILEFKGIFSKHNRD